MSLFEMHNGQLRATQLGIEASHTAQTAALKAARQQIGSVTQRPLFAISWQQHGERHTLTALDPAGQVVTVEVLHRLDADVVKHINQHLAEINSANWGDLARRYPGGIQAFRADWNKFRETQPARVLPGPRLIILSVILAADVQSALPTLIASGTEIHRLSVRQLDSGRQIVNVERIAAELLHPAAGLPANATVSTNPDLEISGDESIAALAAVAATLHEATTLTWQDAPKNISHQATLQPDGRLTLPDQRSFRDPNQAADVVQNTTGTDGWQVWRFGPNGPKLREALEEIIAAEQRRPRDSSPASGRRSRRRLAS